MPKGLSWGESKYKSTMPQELINMFAMGDDRSHFCKKYNISTRTFHDWINTNPQFAEAYEIAKEKAKAHFLNVAMDHLVEEPEGPRLNTKLWSMLMRNRFELTEHRKLKIEGLKRAQNFQEQMQSILDELAKGNLTGSEAQQLAKLVETGVSVNQHTEMAKRIEELEKADKLGASDSDFKD